MPTSKKTARPEKRTMARSTQCRAQMTSRDQTGKFAAGSTTDRTTYAQLVTFWLTDSTTGQPFSTQQAATDDATRFALALLNKYMQLGTVGLPDDRLPQMLAFGKWVYAQSAPSVREAMLRDPTADRTTSQMDSFKAILASYAFVKGLRAF